MGRAFVALFAIVGGLIMTSMANSQDSPVDRAITAEPHDSGLGKNDPIGEDPAPEPAPEAEAVEADAPSESFLTWVFGALGWRYGLSLPLAALVSFVVTGMLLIGAKGKSTGAAMAFV